MHLTPRQQEILDLLRRHAATSDQSPTLNELCQALGLRSRGSMHKHIQALVRAGAIECVKGRPRGIRVLPEQPPEDHLPLLGRIAAGHPIEPVSTPEFIEIPDWMRTSRECYILEVTGNSMRDAGILDGDYVVIEQRDQAANGEIVVALVHGQEVTLKRLDQTPEHVILRAENPEMPPLQYAPDEVRIQGVLVGQMRAYQHRRMTH